MAVTSPSPTRVGRTLSRAELREVVERYAAAVRAGRHRPGFDTEQRWHVRIHADDDVDVWLIGWTTEQGTELHDHGGSSGAFAVVEGVLDEHVWSGRPEGDGRLLRHPRRRGEVVDFAADYVHDVRNHRKAPAVSVHAYSPPIRLMRFFDEAAGRLRRRALTWTDDPETPAPPGGGPVAAPFADVDAMLDAARGAIARLAPHEAARAVEAGARLVDIRPEWQRRADGEIPGSLVVERNHLEWRLHPRSDARLPAADTTGRWVVVCTEGYTSSLAAASLVSLGLDAADLVGGVHAWREAGLPTVPGGTPVEHVVPAGPPDVMREEPAVAPPA